ncbi:glycerol dehydratase reactivase beta/small subunit family protein [Citrobacter freundii]|uniref:glycerol dehydratase reactivase beta/small subunit family protein n=1 Tax=Citrobacter freundii TaxID=546 RepID=UPI001A19A4BF|nr:glycerol dehydratase reactivase beta/small subunit family protein [Citrobacter freundii]MDK2360288.1 glycerol dehydratase reactivase beta/small subunit family protein [Citrobacter freundii]HAU4328662.1 propanediol dehydratase [Citrobacter freundii]
MESNLTTPAIVIFTVGDCTSRWNDVLLGIEEEGIPFVIRETHSTDIIHNAWLAACQSPLLVGIGCDQEKLVVHYKNLPTSAPLFTLMYQQNSHDRRSIGNNAARLVKGIPFRECHS